MRPNAEVLWDHIIQRTCFVSLITLISSAFRRFLRMLLFSCCRSPSDFLSGWGSDVMVQPSIRAQASNTHLPPRLHTAPQEGFKQQNSQHRGPPPSTASGRQPRPMTLLQWIPSTPPVTVHMLPETPERGTCSTWQKQWLTRAK